MKEKVGMEASKHGNQSNSRNIEARETFTTLLEISRILNTGLDRETLAICVRLCEQGANPEALATVIKELRRETEAIKNASEAS
ncbi:mitotic-spindle organizing protein 1-like [Eurytemora carolleeae]|uniref:mitotic-spindle organizing protein 1-like n=1 Tax=Eurytemora carolleeae TaxID=1294199 RepID=UPI000C76556B|nr:mitotic-spindle organizing protein 1-like [Eurytemora carolleeae]|eukprot:XP_023333687.1 mitotic-spindle organizing protein 1-like [Eurytemora affinis]